MEYIILGRRLGQFPAPTRRVYVRGLNSLYGGIKTRLKTSLSSLRLNGYTCQGILAYLRYLTLTQLTCLL